MCVCVCELSCLSFAPRCPSPSGSYYVHINVNADVYGIVATEFYENIMRL